MSDADSGAGIDADAGLRARLSPLLDRSVTLRGLVRSRFPVAALSLASAAALTVGLVESLSVYGRTLPTALTSTHTMEYAEGFVLYFATHWTYLFHPIEQSPFIVTNYPPLYYVLVGLVNAPLGNAFLAGRLVTVASTLATGALLAGLVYRYGERSNPLPSILVAALFYATPTVRFWGIVARVDALGVALSAGALYWYATREGRRQFLGAGLLCLLALYTKQSYVAAPAAIVLAEAWRGEWRRGLRFGAGLGAVGLAGLGALALATGGRAWAHIVTYNANPWHLRHLLRWVERFADVHLPLVLVASALGALYLARGEGAPRPPSVVGTYLAMGALAALLVGKEGSNVNYFLHLTAGLCLAAGVVLTDALRTERIPAVAATLLLFLLAIQGALFANPPDYPSEQSLGPSEMAPFVAAEIDDADGPVLTSDPGLLVHNDQPVVYKPFLLKELHEAGRWDQSRLLEKIRGREYDYVVLQFDPENPGADWHSARWTEEQIAAIRERYRYESSYGDYWIYVPAGDGSVEREMETRESGT
jgi:hypothetical protein